MKTDHKTHKTDHKKLVLGHAVLYLKRKKSRTAVLTAIFFLLLMLVLSGITLTAAVQDSLTELRRQFFACVTVECTFDEENVVTPELAGSVVQVVEPEKWTGINTFYLSMKELFLCPGKFTAEGTEAARTARMVACTESALAREFTDGKLELAKGRAIESGDTEKAVISEYLAEANGLKIGDTITGTVTDEIVMRARAGVGNTYRFEIVGIFTVAPEADNASPQRAEPEILSNYIYVDEASGMQVAEEVWQTERQYTNGLILQLEDPALLDASLENVISIPGYHWDSYFINTNSADYDRSAAPLTQMNRILSAMLIAVLLLGLIILVIVLTMWNQERTGEIGILLSLGFSKRQIVGRLMAENLLVYLCSLILCVPFVYGGVRILAEVLELPGAGLRAGSVITAGAGGMIFCVIVTVLSCVRIMRVNPREILTMIN